MNEIKLKPGHVYIHDAEEILHGRLGYLRSIRGDKPVKRWQKEPSEGLRSRIDRANALSPPMPSGPSYGRQIGHREQGLYLPRA